MSRVFDGTVLVSYRQMYVWAADDLVEFPPHDACAGQRGNCTPGSTRATASQARAAIAALRSAAAGDQPGFPLDQALRAAGEGRTELEQEFQRRFLG